MVLCCITLIRVKQIIKKEFNACKFSHIRSLILLDPSRPLYDWHKTDGDKRSRGAYGTFSSFVTGILSYFGVDKA